MTRKKNLETLHFLQMLIRGQIQDPQKPRLLEAALNLNNVKLLSMVGF